MYNEVIHKFHTKTNAFNMYYELHETILFPIHLNNIPLI